MHAADEISSIQSEDWRDLYLAALFEINEADIPFRIEEAEKVILARTRDLASSSDGTRERNSLDSALLALRALRTCVGETKPGTSQAESSGA